MLIIHVHCTSTQFTVYSIRTITIIFIHIHTNRAKVGELEAELGEIHLDMLELKQKKFERTAGNLNPRLLQKMVKWCLIHLNDLQYFYRNAPDQYLLDSTLVGHEHVSGQEACSAQRVDIPYDIMM